ncbi:response regulator [Kocuria sp.]|uniref:response regulator n=1 Tax=Kocuria sp. TaxID=1871328 RepID=UPI0026DF7E68|nr:response regulator [Kocuria sp.]MDO5619475.1 response regulator [Kocuria sp.]
MSGPHTPLRVLIVEDEPLTARAHTEYVQHTPGFDPVGTAGTAAEALRAVAGLRKAGRPVDLILLDVNLPDATGLDVARRLRGAGEDVDILAVTAHRDVATVRAASALGVVGYVIKPFLREDLVHRLEAYRDYRHALSTAGTVDQESLDRTIHALRSPGSPGGTAPKGLTPETLRRVEQILSEGAWFSATELAAQACMSRVTARRYLEHLADRGLAQRRPRHGTVGRPEMEYGRS